MIQAMVRYGIIFGLIFESLVLLCCGRLMPAATAAQPSSCCATDQPNSSCCCCADASPTAGTPDPCHESGNADSISQRCASRCECPITLGSPRVPAVPDRRPSLDPARAAVLGTTFAAILTPPGMHGRDVVHPCAADPPPDWGRRLCERQCRWTI